MNKQQECGYVLWEVLLVISLLGVLLAVAVPRGQRCLQAAAVEYETACLLSDLRYAQTQARTMVESIYGMSDRVTHSSIDYRRQIRVQADGYRIYFGRDRILREHQCLPGIQLDLVRTGADSSVEFYNDGKPSGNCTITVKYREADGTVGVWRKILVNPAGRIRISYP